MKRYWAVLIALVLVAPAVYVLSLPERVPSKVNLMMSYWYVYIEKTYKPELKAILLLSLSTDDR